MDKEERIPVEEDTNEAKSSQSGEEKVWTEEFVVAGEEVLDTVKRLIKEAGVRRIVIKNREKRILFEIPLLLGLAGIALLPMYAALALIGALAADCTILVERTVKESETA